MSDHCDLCGDAMTTFALPVRYTPDYFEQLVEHLDREPLETFTPLAVRVGQGPYCAGTDHGRECFTLLRTMAHLRLDDWVLCTDCGDAIGRVLAGDGALAATVGLGWMGR